MIPIFMIAFCLAACSGQPIKPAVVVQHDVVTIPCLSAPIGRPAIYANSDLHHVSQMCKNEGGKACGVYVDMLSINEAMLRQYAAKTDAAMMACVK